jgi:hypothetical protein
VRSRWIIGVLALLAAAAVVVAYLITRTPAANVVAQHFIVAVAPNVPPTAREEFRVQLLLFLLRDMPIGSSFELVDGLSGSPIVSGEVPAHRSYATNPGSTEPSRTRIARFERERGEINAFLLQQRGPSDAPAGTVDPITVLQYVADYAARQEPRRRIEVIIVGDPLYDMPDLPQFSFRDRSGGYFPNDAMITAPPEISIFSTVGQEASLQGILVHWITIGGSTTPALGMDAINHQSRVEAFWRKYVRALGGQMGAYNDTATTTFADAASSRTTYASPGDLDLTETRPMMVSIQRQTLDRVIQDLLFTPTARIIEEYPQDRPLPTRSGAVRIGIAWECGSCDIDLYVTPDIQRTAEELSFQRRRTAAGAFWKDFAPRNGIPAAINGYEYVELDNAADIRAVQASLNFYSGESAGGVSGTFRVEVGGHIYARDFFIPASSGNLGAEAETRRRSSHWQVIQLGDILPP